MASLTAAGMTSTAGPLPGDSLVSGLPANTDGAACDDSQFAPGPQSSLAAVDSVQSKPAQGDGSHEQGGASAKGGQFGMLEVKAEAGAGPL